MLSTGSITQTHYRETLQGPEEPVYGITVDIGNLEGPAGNGFVIVGTVRAAIRKSFGEEAAEEFAGEAMSGDYLNLLTTVAKYVHAIGDNVDSVVKAHTD
jgi:hypothetical protein